MNIKRIIPAFMLCAALAASANGYTDGIDYYRAGQFENAKTILNRTLNDAGTDKAMAYYYLGQTALALKNQNEALTNFEKGKAANAENPYNYVGIGAIDLLKGDVKAADENFKLAQKLGKKNHEITVDIARAYFNADPVKYSKEVDKYLQKARKDSKNTEPAIYILEGDIKFANRELGDAAASYEQAITFEKDNPEGYVKYANAYMGVNPLYGVNKLEELLALQPTSALAQRELAEKYYETSQWTKAAQQYGNYIQNPNHFPEDKARYAVLLYANSEYEKSLQIANEILAQTPNDFQTMRIKMLDLSELGKNDDVLRTGEVFLNLKNLPANAKYNPIDYITYAQALENASLTDDALHFYKKAVELDPTRAANQKLLSDAYNKAGQYQLAAETYDLYIANTESPSLTDFLGASGRWLNASNRAEDPTVSVANAEKGLVAINQVIERTSQVEPEFYQRQGRLNFAKAGRKADKNVFDSYAKVIELLDANPANADATNPENRRNLYNEAYLFMGNYYQELDDKDNRDKYYQLADSYKDK